MDPVLFATLEQLVNDARNQMVVDREIVKAAYDRYQILAAEAWTSKQTYQAREEAMRLLCINPSTGL